MQYWHKCAANNTQELLCHSFLPSVLQIISAMTALDTTMFILIIQFCSTLFIKGLVLSGKFLPVGTAKFAGVMDLGASKGFISRVLQGHKRILVVS